MGYTHYYQMKGAKSREWDAAWPQLIQDAKWIVDAADVKIAGPDGEECRTDPEDDVEEYDEHIKRIPIISVKEGIRINGVSSMAHEPLILARDDEWTFVKTMQKPYDVVVACILLRAKMLVPNGFHLSTDGRWDDEWVAARELYKSLWPHDQLQCPWEED